MGDLLYLIIGIAVLGVALLVGLVTSGRRGRIEPPPGGTDVITPRAGDTDVITTPPAETDVEAPVDEPPAVDLAPTPTLERPEGTASRLVRLRQRLAALAGRPGPGPARAALAGPARRGHLGVDRGHPAHRRHRRRPHPGAGRAAAHPDARRGRRCGRRPGRAPRGAAGPGRPVDGPPAPGERRGRQPRRRPRGRRQRLRQDHHGRQARPDPGRRGPQRRARRGRHVPRRGRRPAGDLGRAGRRRGRPRPRGHRPRQRRLRGGQGGRGRPASTPSSSTPPAGCRTSRA